MKPNAKHFIFHIHFELSLLTHSMPMANDQQIYIETSQLICQAYHLIGLSMKGKLILNGLMRIIAQRASAKSCMDILANSCILVKIFLMFEKINKLIHSERQSSKQDNILIK